jgi:hypothetical protein
MARSVRRHAAGVAGDGGANPISRLGRVLYDTQHLTGRPKRWVSLFGYGVGDEMGILLVSDFRGMGGDLRVFFQGEHSDGTA